MNRFVRLSLYCLLCAVFVLATAHEASAQSRKLLKGQKALALFQFDKAINAYTKVISKRPTNYEALSGLADIYRITGDYDNALKWYAEVVKSERCSPIERFYYGQMLRTAGQYDQAKFYYLKYEEEVPSDPRGKRLAEGIDKIPQWLKDSLSVRVTPFQHNSATSDFSPAYYRGDSVIVFASSRGTGKIDELWSGTPFLDLFITEKQDTGFTAPAPLPGNVNKEFHEGPLVVDTANSIMYFTRNNYIRKKKKGEEGIMKLKVFKAEFKDGKWTEVSDLPFNSDEYSVGHPTLSPDGKYLFFASDMPHDAAQGGQDLYYVEITSSGFEPPVNLGPGINTPGDEVFPYMHKNGTLLFASDSYEGFGGLDIYSATKSSDRTWGNVTNVGYPINSSRDDFGLIYNKTFDGGLFSSNRPGGAGSDDIYLFDKKNIVILVGKVIDKKTRETISDAIVKLVEQGTDETADSLHTDKKGRFEFTLSINKDYSVSADKYGYFLSSEIAVSTRKAGKDTIEIVLELQRISVGEVVKLENIYYDFDKYDIRPDAAKELNRFVSFMNKYPGLVVELRSHTDCRGSDTYNKWLSQKRAESVVSYVIKHGIGKDRITAKGFGESMPVNKCTNRVQCTEEEHQMNRRTEFVVIKQPEGLKVKSSVQ